MQVFISEQKLKSDPNDRKFIASYDIEVWLGSESHKIWEDKKEEIEKAIFIECQYSRIDLVEYQEKDDKINATYLVEVSAGDQEQFAKQVKQNVGEIIAQGDSQLAAVLSRGLSMDHVEWAIKNRKCVHDLGSTYLETIVGNAIRKIYQGQIINMARAVFGMGPVDIITPSQMQTMRLAAKQQQAQL